MRGYTTFCLYILNLMDIWFYFYVGDIMKNSSMNNSCEKKRSESKGETERYKHLNAEFQRIARRDKKAFLSDQCKERGKQQNGKD